MAFDKTGTITLGRPQVVDYGLGRSNQGAEESLRLAAGVEQEVSHPFARAVVAAVGHVASRFPRQSMCAWQPAAAPGGGSRIIRSRWANHPGSPLRRRIALYISDWKRVQCGRDCDPMDVSPARWFSTIRAGPRPEAVRALGRMGVSCHLLSGDRREVVARVAIRLAARISPATCRRPTSHCAARAARYYGGGAGRHGRGRRQ